MVEDDREHGSAAVTDSDNSYSRPTQDLEAAAIHERSDDRVTPPLGENSTERGEAVVPSEDYEADYNENDRDSEHGETVAIEGNAGDVDWETTPSDAQLTRDNLEQHENQDETWGTDEREQDICIVAAVVLKSLPADPGIIDLTVADPDDDHITVQQGRWFPSAAVGTPANFTSDADTDSIGQRTLDEFADAQEIRDDHPRGGGESNSTTGECSFSAPSALTLTHSPARFNDLDPELDQLGDDFNWDEDFGGDLDGEFGEFDNRGDLETKRVDSQEPTPGRSSKRGFDEIDSDTADEEETPGDVSPSKLFHAPCVSPNAHMDFTYSRFKTEEGAVV